MAEIRGFSAIPERRRANKADVSAFFGVSLPTVNEWVKKGCPVIQKGIGAGIPWIFDLLEVMLWKYGATERDDQLTPDQMLPKDRKDWYDSELKRTELERKSGLLIPAGDAQVAIATAFSVISQHLRSMPDNLERRIGISPELAEQIERETDEYLNELANALNMLTPAILTDD
jgi:phage terminase Nu1 subunit (DNA packaging protein)